MSEVVMARLYELIVILYAISIVLYFLDYMYKNIKVRRVAFWLVSIVWVFQTSFLIIYAISEKRFPILSLTEGVYFYAWLLTSLSIVLHCIAKVDLPVVLVNIVSFICMTIYLFAPNSTGAVNKMIVSEILFIHIGFAMVSYAAFTISFVFAILYLILYRMLKKKKFDQLWSRLPNLKQTTSWMHNSVLVGVPLLCISLVLGLEWALLTIDSVTFLDFKIVGSFIIAVLYCIVIVLYRNGKLIGPKNAWVHIYAFLLVVINFFLGSKLSNFHLWF